MSSSTFLAYSKSDIGIPELAASFLAKEVDIDSDDSLILFELVENEGANDLLEGVVVDSFGEFSTCFDAFSLQTNALRYENKSFALTHRFSKIFYS